MCFTHGHQPTITTSIIHSMLTTFNVLFTTGFSAFVTLELTAADISKPIHLLPANSLDSFYVYTKTHGLKDPKKVFTLADGTLRISGHDEGYLATKTEYSSYRLVAEYKWGVLPPERKERDSGVFVHGYGPDQWLMSSLECNVLSGGKSVSGAVVLIGPQSQLAVNGVVKKGFAILPVERKDHEKPIGEWNTMEILSDGGRLQVKLNGHTVTEGKEAAPQAGKILLQSRWGEIFFRRLELHPVK